MINFLLRIQFLCILSLNQLRASLAKGILNSAIILIVATEILLWCGGLVFSQISKLTLIVWGCKNMHPEVKRNGSWFWHYPTVRVSILRHCTAEVSWCCGWEQSFILSSFLLHYYPLCFTGTSVGAVWWTVLENTDLSGKITHPLFGHRSPSFNLQHFLNLVCCTDTLFWPREEVGEWGSLMGRKS